MPHPASEARPRRPSPHDPLLDDGAHYAEHLHKAGVPVTYVVAKGHIHGSHSFTKVIASARVHSDDLTAVLRDTHARTTPPRGRPTTLDAFGIVDVLVNKAGNIRNSPFTALTSEASH